MSDRTNTDGYRFVLNYEEVADDDRFVDKTHEHVANALYHLIADTPRGLTIGLEGGWGAGKSTVVALLRRRLVPLHLQGGTRFFLFDAWAHDGDPLRRVFLESLIDALDPEAADDNLQSIKEEVSGRLKVVESETTSGASKLGKLVAFSGLFIPFGAGLIAASDLSRLAMPFTAAAGAINWSLLVGIIFALSPLAVLMYWAFRGERNPESQKISWDIFESESTETQTQNISDDSERTSIEFERYFQKIISYICDEAREDRAERLCIVVDNLDRLDAKSARSIWSTLQTYFQHRSIERSQRNEVLDKIWFIVPYDPTGLSRIWVETTESPPSVANSFMEKNFQLTLEVPYPILSSWDDFTEGSIEGSLTGWPEEARVQVLSEFRKHVSRWKVSPTPRKILRWINQVGLLGERWGGCVSVESIVTYALLRLELNANEVRDYLLRGNAYADRHSVPIIANENTRSEIAGLLFGVSKEKGIEVLLSQPVLEAYRYGNIDELQQLASTHVRAFPIVWHAVGAQRQISHELDAEMRFAMTRALYGVLQQSSIDIGDDIRQMEEALLHPDANWDINKLDYAAHIRLLRELKGEGTDFEEKTCSFVRKLTNTYVSGEKWSEKGVKHLNNLFEELKDWSNPIPDQFYKALDHERWVNWLQLQTRANIQIHGILPREGLVKEMASLLSESQPELEADVVNTLNQTVPYQTPTEDWGEVADKLSAWFVLPNRAIGKEDVYRLALSIGPLCTEEKRGILLDGIRNEAFWARASREKLPDTPSLTVLAALAWGDELLSSSITTDNIKRIWSQEELLDSETSRIYQAFVTWEDEPSLWQMAAADRGLLARSIIDRHDASTELFTFEAAVIALNCRDWPEEDAVKLYVQRLCKQGTVEVALPTLTRDALNYDCLIARLTEYGDNKTKDQCKAILDKLDTSAWSCVLEGNSDLLKAVILQPTKPSYHFSEAFKAYYQDVIAGKAADEWIRAHFDQLLEKVKDGERVMRDLLREFIGSENDTLLSNDYDSLRETWSNQLKYVEPDALITRLTLWLEGKVLDRISWVTDVNGLDLTTTSSEGLVSRCNEFLQEDTHSDDDENVVLSLLRNLGEES